MTTTKDKRKKISESEHKQEIEGIISFGDELKGKTDELEISDYSHAYQMGYLKGQQDLTVIELLKEIRKEVYRLRPIRGTAEYEIRFDLWERFAWMIDRRLNSLT